MDNETLPAGQELQLPPLNEYEPLGQQLQPVLSASEYLPEGHSKHVCAPAAEYEPSEHLCVQSQHGGGRQQRCVPPTAEACADRQL